jgi:hypothetical protein
VGRAAAMMIVATKVLSGNSMTNIRAKMPEERPDVHVDDLDLGRTASAKASPTRMRSMLLLDMRCSPPRECSVWNFSTCRRRRRR